MAKADEGKSRRNGEQAVSDTMFGAIGVPGLDPLFQASNRLLDAWLAVSNELMEFGTAQLDRSLEMQQAMARATSLNEAIDLQTKFARSAVEDYLSEASKLADLSARSLLDSVSSLQHASDREMGEAGKHQVSKHKAAEHAEAAD
jgi:hypothetical protein